MKLDTVSASGLKNTVSFSHSLDLINLVVGPNFTGKTSIIDAIFLALCGETRLVGKTKIKSLIDVNTLDVKVTSDGTIWDRAWRIKSNGSCSNTRKDVPEGFEFNQWLFNPEKIAGLSPSAARGEITGLVSDPIKFDWTEFERQTDQIKLPVKQAKLLSDAIEGIAESERTSRMADNHILDWFPAEIDRMNGLVSTARATAKRFRESIAADESLNKGRSAADVHRLKEKVDDLESQIRDIDEKIKSADAVNKRRQTLLEHQSKLEQARTSLASAERSMSETAKKIEILKQTEAGLVAKFDIPKLEATVEEKKKIVLAVEQLLEKAEAEKGRADESLAKIRKLDFACPKCGADAATIRESLEADALVSQEKACQAVRDSEEGLRKANADHDAASKALKSERDSLAKETSGIVGDIAKLTQHLVVYGRDKAKAESDIAVHESHVGEAIPEEVVVAELAGAKLELQGFLNKSRAEHEEALADVGAEKKKEESRAEAEKADVEVEIYSQLSKILTGLFTTAVNDSIGKVLGPINDFVRPIIGADIDWRDGFCIDGRAKDFSVMTDAEKVIVTAGIAFALARNSDIKLLIVDELGRLDEDTLLIFIDHINLLIQQGAIDQFIGIVARPEKAPPLPLDPALGVNVIRKSAR